MKLSFFTPFCDASHRARYLIFMTYLRFKDGRCENATIANISINSPSAVQYAKYYRFEMQKCERFDLIQSHHLLTLTFVFNHRNEVEKLVWIAINFPLKWISMKNHLEKLKDLQAFNLVKGLSVI